MVCVLRRRTQMTQMATKTWLILVGSFLKAVIYAQESGLGRNGVFAACERGARLVLEFRQISSRALEDERRGFGHSWII